MLLFGGIHITCQGVFWSGSQNLEIITLNFILFHDFCTPNSKFFPSYKIHGLDKPICHMNYSNYL